MKSQRFGDGYDEDGVPDADTAFELHDLALAFAWQLRSPDLPRSLDLDPILQKIAVNAVFAHQMGWSGVHYPRRKASYVGQKRYQGELYTFLRVLAAVEEMERRGLIENWIAPVCSTGGVESTFYPTQALLDAAPTDIFRALEYRPRESIRLRDGRKHLIDYRDTDKTGSMRRKLAAINEALLATSIGLSEDLQSNDPIVIVDGVAVNTSRTVLHRVFNESWGRGGRFYGGWWQGLPKPRRNSLTINGEDVVEPDYAQLHPRLLYRRISSEPPGDAYMLDDWPRKVTKRGFNILLNATNASAAAGAVAKMIDLENPKTAVPGARRLITALTAKHRPIKQWFHSGVGITLQAEDPIMCERVLFRLLRKGVVVLAVHDPFMAPNRHEGLVREAMDEALHAICRI
jgi:hypothetical protein